MFEQKVPVLLAWFMHGSRMSSFSCTQDAINSTLVQSTILNWYINTCHGYLPNIRSAIYSNLMSIYQIVSYSIHPIILWFLHGVFFQLDFTFLANEFVSVSQYMYSSFDRTIWLQGMGRAQFILDDKFWTDIVWRSTDFNGVLLIFLP